MEIRPATPSRAPIAAQGTRLSTTAWYAATGDLRPRPVPLSRDLLGVVGGSCATNAAVAAGTVATVALKPAALEPAALEPAALEAVASEAPAAQQQVMHLPFLPLQGTHPRGAPV